jgi:hypothetical protein
MAHVAQWRGGCLKICNSPVKLNCRTLCGGRTLSRQLCLFSVDKTRNTMASLVATLAYQIIHAIPTTLDDIIQTTEQNLLIWWIRPLSRICLTFYMR